MPLISVVMTSYNYGNYISEAIDSVLAQTFSDLELIIVDDASEDNSKDIIRKYANKYTRIKAIFHQENLGISRTVNDGWNAASGKFIASISSDDMWASDKLEKQLEILQEDEDLVVWTEGEIVDRQGRATGQLFSTFHGAEGRRKSGDIFEELLKGNFIFGSSRIFKKGSLEGREYSENLKYLSDYRFAVDMASEYEYYFIEEPLTKYRMHGNNTVNRDIEGYQMDTVKLAEYFLSTYGDKIPNDIRVHLHLLSVNTLKNQLSQANSQLSQAEREIKEMKSSVIWQALMAYQEIIVERGLPQGTGRREAYDHFIECCRTIVNEGWRSSIDCIRNRH
jgi:glycosyltransferase involved in cell wall biosynthesis